MTEEVREIRTAVRRKGAQRYVLLSLVSFAMSVILTRLFLELAGYPQLGNSELHIAHVLWGGLLLFVASLLPLLLSNRWAHNLSAILSGVGVGLFIDEVGKFITQSNDYFYPPAAPIIYAFFLLTVLLYMRVSRPPLETPRAEMYRILEEITEVLDCDLDEIERDQLEARLARVKSETNDDNLKRLADALYAFLEHESVQLVPATPTLTQRVGSRISPFLEHQVTQPRLKMFLIFVLGVMGVLALIEFSFLLLRIPSTAPALEMLLEPLVTTGELRSAQDASWFLVRTILEGTTGLLLILSGAMMIIGRERTGIQLATMMLIIWLTVINLLVFYLDQFGAVVTTLFQFFVLMMLTYYRRRYLAIK
jgi:hypothetical protein